MPLLGCIADDLTGATDLAAMLVAQGMTTVQRIGVPHGPLPEADAAVIALRSRTAPAADAVAASLAACEALLAGGARQIFLRCGLAFDSTEAGNIGPVADALLRRLQSGFAVVCPAFPAQGGSVFQGHLFLGGALLSESGMAHHPRTPMRDANLPRLLSRQTEGGVGLLPFAVVEQGPPAIRRAITQMREGGRRYAVADALTEAHLRDLGAACADHALIVGSTGLAMGLPENFRAGGLLPDRPDAGALPPPRGAMAVLAGSCSRAALAQVGLARLHLPVLELDVLAMPDAAALAAEAESWMRDRLSEERPVVIATSAPAGKVAALRARLGQEAADALVGEALARIAALLVARGVGRLLVSGEDTAEAVLRRLGIDSLRVGPQIEAGLPWTRAEPDGPWLALAPGQSGARDLFLKAFA
ncbi:3-oxo-tetronate kinase [Teichococcus aerofrigidensis]